jgi:hypothetical protein
MSEVGIEAALEGLRAYAGSLGAPMPSFLLVGYPKSGNTYLRLLYHNLIRAEHTDATQSLTYTELNRINPNTSLPDGLAMRGFIAPPGEFDHRRFPVMLHSHAGYGKGWQRFGPAVHVYRNPLDGLLSHWYAMIDFVEDLRGSIGVDEFVIRHIDRWIDLHKANHAHADLAVRYEDLVAAPRAQLERMLAVLEVSALDAALDRAVAMSAFSAIRAMEERSGELHGHRSDPRHRSAAGLAPWRSGARFTRSGQVGQWRDLLRRSTIDHVVGRLHAAGLSEGSFIFGHSLPRAIE